MAKPMQQNVHGVARYRVTTQCNMCGSRADHIAIGSSVPRVGDPYINGCTHISHVVEIEPASMPRRSGRVPIPQHTVQDVADRSQNL